MFICYMVFQNGELLIFDCAKQRKAMRSEWQKVVDKGLTAEAAQEEYIKAVRDLEESIGIKE